MAFNGTADHQMVYVRATAPLTGNRQVAVGTSIRDRAGRITERVKLGWVFFWHFPFTFSSQPAHMHHFCAPDTMTVKTVLERPGIIREKPPRLFYQIRPVRNTT
jgi:hypothetical protein